MPEYYEYFNLSDMEMPVQVDKFTQLLRAAHYDLDEIKFLESRFKSGFELGYTGPTDRRSKAPNLPIRVGSHEELWNKIMKEVNMKRVAGPYDKIPFNSYIQSPLGLVWSPRPVKTRRGLSSIYRMILAKKARINQSTITFQRIFVW